MDDMPSNESTERERLIFGAGFAFGVMFTMLILAMVLSTVVSGPVSLTTLLTSAVLLPVVAAFVFAAVVGFALYFLALPETGFGIPAAPLFDESDRSDVDVETK